MGKSIDVCLKELNLKSDENVFVSKLEYQSKQPLMLLDLGIPSLNDSLENEELLKCLFTFPLIVMCSFRVDDSTVSFKEEYIFPQLMLQLVRSYKIKDIVKYDGIIYTSTKISADERAQFTDGEYNNIAIPSKGFLSVKRDIEFCEYLCECFYASNPISLKFKAEIDKSVREKLLLSKSEYICTKNIDLKKIPATAKRKN